MGWWQKTVNHTGFETGPWCTAQADLELLMQLHQFSEYCIVPACCHYCLAFYHCFVLALLRNEVLSYVAFEFAILLPLTPRAGITDTHTLPHLA